MLVLCGILLMAGVVVLVLEPLLRPEGAPLTDGSGRQAQLVELYALKETTYETIRDLEFDFHAGKIGEPDYRELSERTKREAALILRRIDALEADSPPSRRAGPEAT